MALRRDPLLFCPHPISASPRLLCDPIGFSLDVVGPVEPTAEKGPTRNAAETFFLFCVISCGAILIGMTAKPLTQKVKEY